MTNHVSSHGTMNSFVQANPQALPKHKGGNTSFVKVSARVALLLASVSSFSIISAPAYANGTTKTFSPAANTSNTITDTLADSNTNAPLSVIQNGAGTTILSATNTYTGATSINQGTLTLSGTGSIAQSSGIAIAKDAQFDLSKATADVNIQDMSGQGNTNLGANTLNLSKAQGSYDGVISGTGGLTINAGTKTLTSAQNYTGDTSINNGATLALSGNANLANTRIQLNNQNVSGNSTFDISQASQPVDVKSVIWGNNGAVINLGSNTLNITSAGLEDTNGATYQSNGGTIHVAGQKEGFRGTITGKTNFIADAPIVDFYATHTFDYTGDTTVKKKASLNIYGTVNSTPHVTIENGGTVMMAQEIGRAHV